MTRKSAVGAIGLGLLAIALSGPEARAAEKLVYATYISDVYSASKTDIWLMKEIEKRSNGEITFETYWSNSLLKAADLFPGLRSGAADVVLGAPAAYNPREYPLSHVVMPFLTTNANALTLAWNEFYRSNADFRKEFESKGAKVLYASSWAENTVWSKRPIAKIDDFKGLKVRAVPPISDALQKLGATPVALAWGEGLEGLQRGVVDGMSAAPFDSAVHGNIQDVAKHGTDAGGTGPFAMAVTGISLARYNKLSEKHRKIIDEVAAEAPAQGIKMLEESVDAAVAKLCGMKDKLAISAFSADDIDKVQKTAAATLQDDWVKRVSTEAKVDGKAMLAQFKGLLEKYEEQSSYVTGFDRYKKKCG